MKYPCPVCGNAVFNEPSGNYEICPVCNWEDDPVQLEKPDFEGGANTESLNQAKENWAKSEVRVCILNGDEGGIENVYRRLATGLQFPDYFGNNADALDECLSEIKVARIVWNDSKKAADSLGVEYSKIVGVIQAVCQENPDIKLVLN